MQHVVSLTGNPAAKRNVSQGRPSGACGTARFMLELSLGQRFRSRKLESEETPVPESQTPGGCPAGLEDFLLPPVPGRAWDRRRSDGVEIAGLP